MKENLLLIFVKNPELGNVKTRLAKNIGDEEALKVYMSLLRHTATITKNSSADKTVYYSDHIEKQDDFNGDIFKKSVQVDGDLGFKMKIAFNENFSKGYKKIVIIGSDCAELDQKDLDRAFRLLTTHDMVIGPAKDGGYYLLGLKKPFNALFEDKPWSTENVFKQTYMDALHVGFQISLLAEKSDIDTLEDLEQSSFFSKYTNKIL